MFFTKFKLFSKNTFLSLILRPIEAMNQLIKVNDILDSNKWFSTLGSKIIDILRKSENLAKTKCRNNWCREDHGLLICQDITFINTLIDSQMDFVSNRDCLQSNSLFLNKYFNKIHTKQ